MISYISEWGLNTLMWNSWSHISQNKEEEEIWLSGKPFFSEGRHGLVPLVGESVNPEMFALATTVIIKAPFFIGQPGRPLITLPAYFTFNPSPPLTEPSQTTDGYICRGYSLGSRCMDESGRSRRFWQPPSWHVGKPYTSCKLTLGCDIPHPSH